MVLSQLSTPEKPLLPRLERLTGFVINEDGMCYTILLSPTLRELGLKVSDEVDAGIVRMVMQMSQRTLSTVLRLSINDLNSFAAGRQPPVKFWMFSHLQALEVAHGISLSVNQLQALAAFPNLRSLSLNLFRMPSKSDGNTSDTTVGFLQLHDLALAGLLEDIITFLEMTSPPVLDSIAITSMVYCNGRSVLASIFDAEDAIESLYSTLPLSIQRFRHVVTIHSAHQVFQLLHPEKLFELLCSFSGLLVLDISFIMDSKLLLPDVLLYSLRDAWPDARVIKIAVCSPYSTRPWY
ncbi:hypothetical protein BN946_scf184936.g7 [Trametes cinnabarina]|uniref:Uncharacterized protein n=1 Tax=Pycnoporus cinnabarinus TaxID=5643 RepID=A0A060SSR3_PYCCI|nr:hypothetical protein BN946_scf184936.g7 [Trametes cinnabarina]